jgi:hypothetical protein
VSRNCGCAMKRQSRTTTTTRSAVDLAQALGLSTDLLLRILARLGYRARISLSKAARDTSGLSADRAARRTESRCREGPGRGGAGIQSANLDVAKTGKMIRRGCGAFKLYSVSANRRIPRKNQILSRGQYEKALHGVSFRLALCGDRVRATGLHYVAAQWFDSTQSRAACGQYNGSG